MQAKNKLITLQVQIEKPLNEVWEKFTDPNHIVHWNFASPDWCCPHATNDLQAGGKFSWRMEAKDKSMGFDFSGTYVEVKEHESLKKLLDDNREISLHFTEVSPNLTRVIEIFEAENENPVELQKDGWQAILNNFKYYCEAN